MTNLKFYIVSYNKLYKRVVENLTDDHNKFLTAYFVNKSFEKDVTLEIDSINEWDLPWNDYSYQQKQFYEYSCIVHLTKNNDIIKDQTHVGLLHYDTKFGRDSIEKIIDSLKGNSNQIFYQCLRGPNDLYFNRDEYFGICEFMSQKLNMVIDPIKVINVGWISEAMSVVPKDVFIKFGNFLFENNVEIQNILLQNRWGIMNQINHRICGIVERMWGLYLVNCGLELVQMDVEHDWNFYNHDHLSQKNWINT